MENSVLHRGLLDVKITGFLGLAEDTDFFPLLVPCIVKGPYVYHLQLQSS